MQRFCTRKQKMQKRRNQLRALRKSKGLTLAQLAAKSGVSVGSIGNFETGARGMGGEALASIAEALGVSVADILHEPEAAAGRLAGTVRGSAAPYGQSVCRYPEGCDLTAELTSVRTSLGDLQAQMQEMRGQMQTLLGLLGEPLRKSVGRRQKAG